MAKLPRPPPSTSSSSSISAVAMAGRQAQHLLRFSLLALLAFITIKAQPYDYPTANLSTSWINGPNINHTISYERDGSIIKALLLRRGPGYYGPSFACGFYCRNDSTSASSICSSFLLAIFIVYTNSGALITMPTVAFPQVVWSANRNRPVNENATLQLTDDGDLILKDADKSSIWSTNTSGKSVAMMNLTEDGNLMLVGANGEVVWQSFDDPTDALVPGQKFVEGQKLIANVSTSNWTKGQMYISATSGGWSAFVNSTPPQLYYSHGSSTTSGGSNPSYILFTNGSLNFFPNSSENTSSSSISLPTTSSLQYMRLESNGHLLLYQWKSSPVGWDRVDVMKNLDECDYPTICGRYGICSDRGQCRCPANGSSDENYFKAANHKSPKDGCEMVTPLSCQHSKNQRLLTLNDVAYFKELATSNLTSEEGCKEICIKDCSCKAAFFYHQGNVSAGRCILPSEIFSLKNNLKTRTHYNSIAFIKVQVPQESSSPNSTQQNSTISDSKTIPIATLVGAIIGGLLGLLLLVGVVVFFLKRRNKVEEEEDEDIFDQFTGMPTRFSYEELKVATNDFFEKLGEGGFGSVFKGTLTDGTIIAVKRLENINEGKREFFAEVETIGSIHHIHLVRLIGFCAERFHRLLVFEYMCNGSLDKWIFNNGNGLELGWETKFKIINHIAKGLMYLHEECRQRIAHLDIKPQNILLNDKFDAKVSDFGISKLIDRDQNSVMTRMRGTPGYMAPEWLTSMITEKVDVYGFGVVVVEIVCGRKNLDYSQPEEKAHLLAILNDKAKQDGIIDFVEEYGHNIEMNENEAVKVLRLAIWCLQGNVNKRPSMSLVVKVLEGTANVDLDMEYNFQTMDLDMHNYNEIPIGLNVSSSPEAFLLSGPR